MALRDNIELLVGRSTVLTLDRPITRVALSTPDVADALVTSSREVLIHGKAPGTISLLVWADTGWIDNYDVVVRRDLSSLEERLSQLFPDEPIEVASNGTDVVVSGTVSSKYVVDNAAAVALGYVENAENVVNLLRQQEGVASTQVMLQVRFAEVSRSAVQELGASFFTGITGINNLVGRTSTQQFPVPDFDNDQGLVFSDFLNLFAFHTGENLGAVIKALQTRGLFQSLAEPNLITQNGKEATFLAGGEYPYPVLQGSGLNAAVTIIFKEFGVRLKFTPTVVGGELVHLKVAPEVSALDFTNAITIEGFRVPALSTRRTETEVELRDGQTFAIAGLLDNTVTETMSRVPGIGDIPILGYLFRSRAYQKNQTELVVMITPHIISRDSTGVSSRLPNLAQPFLPMPDETLPPPPPWSPDAEPTVAPDDGAEPARVAAAPVLYPAIIGTGLMQSVGTKVDPDENRGWVKAEVRRAVAERKAVERAQREAEKLAREQAKREAEEAERLARAERERQEAERKAAERAQREAEKLAREQAKREAEEAERLAKAERERQEAERKAAERAQKEADKLAREQAKREAKEAERLAKAERERQEAERKAAERAQREAEKLAREQAKREAEEAERLAKAERERQEAERKAAERAQKEADKLAREQAEREAEDSERRAKEEQKRLEQEHKLAAELENEPAQQGVDEIDTKRSRLIIPMARPAVEAPGSSTEPAPTPEH